MLRRAAPWLVAALLSLAVALSGAWPVATDPSSNLVCDWHHPDCLGNHWLLVWVAERLLSHRGLLHNDSYYFPVGDAPWLAGNGSEGILYVPFHATWRWPVGAGIFLLAVRWWSGMAGYLLGRSTGAGRWPALAAAAVAGSSVYAVQEMGAGRFSQADIGWFLAALAAWVRLARGPSARGVLLAAVGSAVAAALYWYHGVFLALAVLAMLLPLLPRLPWRQLAGAGLLALLLVAPLLAVFLLHWREIPAVGAPSFPPAESWNDALVPQLPFAVRVGRHVGQAMPLPALLLAVLALAAPPRGSRRLVLGLLAMGMAGWWLALGPRAGLYTWFYGLAPPLRRFWWPYRHVLIVLAAVAALASLGLSRLSRGPVAALLAAVAIPLSLRVQGDPVRVHLSHVRLPPEFYSRLAEIPGRAMLQVPFSAAASGVETPLFFQLYHRKAMVNGHAPWVHWVRPPAWDAWVNHNAFLAGLLRYESGSGTSSWSFPAADLQELVDLGVTVFVVDQQQFALALRPLYLGYRKLFTDLFGEPVLRGRRAAAWSASGWTGRTSVELREWHWPSGLDRGGARDQPVVGRRSASPTFDP